MKLNKTEARINKNGNLYVYEDIQCATDNVYPMDNECVKELIFGKDIEQLERGQYNVIINKDM